MIYIEGGIFMMGSTEEEVKKFNIDNARLQQVRVKSFYLADAPVTVKEYFEFCAATEYKQPNPPSWGWKSDCPIVNVSWDDARAYCKWLSEKSGNFYRLPTEIEWEFAAAGGIKGYDKETGHRKHTWPGTSNPGELGEYCWNDNNAQRAAHPVRQKRPNELGLFDMGGNIWEWCISIDHDRGVKSGENTKGYASYLQIIKGGGYNGDKNTICIPYRKKQDLRFPFHHTGFRPAMSKSNFT